MPRNESLIERLREASIWQSYDVDSKLLREAADRIETLERYLKTLETAGRVKGLGAERLVDDWGYDDAA